MLGYEQISLGENEFTTQWKTIAAEEERNRFIAEHTSVVTDGGTLVKISFFRKIQTKGAIIRRIYFMLCKKINDYFIIVLWQRYVLY